MAKLFQINYQEDNEYDSYLTVGEDTDTKESVRDREHEKFKDKLCLHFFDAYLIDEVDGHKIIVE